MNKFSHNFTQREGDKVLAVCDQKLLGKKLSGEDITLEVRKSFYGGDGISKEELLEKASKSTIINAVGNEIVELLTREGLFDEDKILKVDGVSHAQMVKV